MADVNCGRDAVGVRAEKVGREAAISGYARGEGQNVFGFGDLVARMEG